MEAEQLDAAAQAGQAPVGDPGAAVRAEAAVEDVEVRLQLLDPCVAVVAEAPPDEGELAAVGLVSVLLADLLGVGGQLALVAGDRLQELVGYPDERERQPERRGELANLAAVATERQRAAAAQRLANRVRARVRVSVHVAADPGSEGEGQRRVRKRAAIGGDQLLGGVEQALLEEPEAVADLVDDAWALGPHLVGLPEDGDLLGGALHHVLARVELGEQPAEPGLRLQDGAPRRLGRVAR